VGSTIMKVEKRWKNHRSDICRSRDLFDKYGFENCRFVVLEVCPVEEKRSKEQWWLDHAVGAVNERCAIRSKEDKKVYDKEWNEANRDKINHKRRVRREAKKHLE